MPYDAFLSYSHAGDADLAASVQSSLQRFARPWYRTYALRVFRDKTGLSANPALWSSIEQALGESEFLLLLASPHAAASEWVNREVSWFLQNRKPERILIVITGGQVLWSEAAGDFDWPNTTALPPVLRGAFPMEPLYVDLSWAHEDHFLQDSRFRDAILDLAAPLHGRAKDELDSEDLRQHRKTLRIAWSAVALLSLLAVALGVAALYATRQRNVARQQTVIASEQRNNAVQQAHIAEQQRQLAEERRMTALSRQLAAQAVGEAPDHLDGALLEAVEAFRAAPTFEARHALLTALFYSPHLRRFTSGPAHVWRTAALSRDGRTAVALDDDTGSVVVEAPAESAVQPLGAIAGGGKVKSVAVSADGSWFATGEPGKVVIRNTRSRAVQHSLAAGLAGNTPDVLIISPDRTQAAAYESSAGILNWNVASGQLRTPPLRPKRWEVALAFSRNGAMLASGGNDGSIVLWDTASGQPIGSPLLGHKARIFGLAFSPDGKILASGSEDHNVILWDVQTGKALGTPLTAHGLWPLGHDSWGLSVAFSPDGRTLASAAKDRNVILWDVASRKPLGDPLKGHAAPPMAVAFSADGHSLVSLSRDNVVLRWAVDPGSTLGTPLGQGGNGVSSIAFSPDGKALAAASMDDHTVMLWDPERARPLRNALRGQSNFVLTVGFGADATKLLSAAKNRVVEWDLGRGTAKSSALPGTSDAVSQVAFSPDGNSTAWSDGSVLLLRSGTAAPVHFPIALASPDHMVMGLAFAPDGRRLASGGFDGSLALWDVPSRKLVWPAAKAHRMSVEALAFSPDGKILASAAVGTADFDDSVRLWDTQSGQELPPALTGHSEPVRALAFSPDGKMLACAAGDRIVFWDVERRQRLGETAADLSGPLIGLAFSPDGRWLGSGGYDGDPVLWDLRSDTWQRQACAIANRNLDPQEWKRLIGDSPAYRKSCQ